MTKKNKKKFSDAKNAKPPAKQLNLFELHINRRKYDVLGMKSKAERGLPGVSRAKSIKKRKVTLLQEYKLKDKKNLFCDRRIGEKNSAMTAEDKVIARFTAERMKLHSKKSIYNLGDDEELTHRGQTLTEIEKFDDPKSDDDDEEDDENEGRLDSKFVEDAHFGGGIFKKVDNEPKSRKDLIDQLIAESIKRKAEKQKIRQHTYDMTEKLDSDWKELLPLITVSKKTKSDPEPDTKKDDKFANYDVLSKKLKFEARGKPSDRLKSEEEIAKEEKEKLEKLEKERIERMLGDAFVKENTIKHRSADDMDDGFNLDFEPDPILAYNNGVLNTKKGDKNDSSDDDKDESEGENSDKEGGSNESEDDEKEEDGKGDDDDDDSGEEKVDDSDENEDDNDDDSYSDLKESDDSDGEMKNASKTLNTTDTNKSSSEKNASKTLNTTDTNKSSSEKNESPQKPSKSSIPKGDTSDQDEKVTSGKMSEEEIKMIEKKMDEARKELPFTFKIPKEYEDFESLMNKYNADYQSVIIERMIKCHHPSLKEEHKEDLDTLFTFLLQFIQDCACENDKKKNCFKTLDKLSPWLFDLMQWNPVSCSSGVMEVIREKYNEFLKSSNTYPGLDTLVFLKLVSILFPTSDFRHPIVTPTLIFMNEILFRCKIARSKDVSSGLFVASLIFEYCSLSKRFSPEAINFLHCILRLSHPKNAVDLPVRLPLEMKAFDSCNLSISDKKRDVKCSKLGFDDLIRENSSEEFRVNAIFLALNLLSSFFDFWADTQHAILIFEPFIPLLTGDPFGESLKSQTDEVLGKIMKLKCEKLKMLVLQKRKPKPMRLYEPNIEEVHSFKKHQPMGKKKAERAKLLHKYKREMKGALREIRRDRSFLTKLKYRETVNSDMERKRKVQEILSSAAEQQGELRKIQRKKK